MARKKHQLTAERAFSIELKSKEQLKCLSMPSEKDSGVLIEGFLGRLESLSCTEGIMLEVIGSGGSLRLDLSDKELDGIARKSNHG